MNHVIRVERVESQTQMELIKSLRIRVFVEEQGVPLEEEFDEHDDSAVHAIATMDGRAVGTGRMFKVSPSEAYIGRMAVDQDYRRFGVGGQILLFLEKQACEAAVTKVNLHAQTYVKSFYENMGYVSQGKPFLEVDIEHVLMTKELKSIQQEG